MTAMASCSATYNSALRKGRAKFTRFSGKKKAPVKGLFLVASRSVLASPNATTRIGTVCAIEITVYSHIILVKQKKSDKSKRGKRSRSGSDNHSPFLPAYQLQNGVCFYPRPQYV